MFWLYSSVIWAGGGAFQHFRTLKKTEINTNEPDGPNSTNISIYRS